jgi:hypothetical protein
MLIVAMDTNYRLQSCLCLSARKHPSLSPGWAYFIDNSPYADVIRNYVDNKEVREPPIASKIYSFTGRSDRVWAFKPSSICSPRNLKVFVQLA